jgi:hypothetical protein
MQRKKSEEYEGRGKKVTSYSNQNIIKYDQKRGHAVA